LGRINILGIETSCDETSAAVVVNGKEIKSNVISSQIDTHQRFGGVVPEIASRKHVEKITLVVEQAMAEAGIDFKDLTAIAVTHGPGLVGALLVGVSAAKAMAYALKIPVIGVHHLVGHIYANFLHHPDLRPPLVCLVVSGGHTSLLYLEDHQTRRMLGCTRDDAAGEVFDKIARTLELGYPGGPQIEKLALEGDASAIPFPRSWLEERSLDFSFSGLKSAVINYFHNAIQRGETVRKADIAASFQAATVEVLVEKTLLAAQKTKVNTVILAGGVAANVKLRTTISERAAELGMRVFYPPPVLCTDNAAMIACAGYFQYLRREFAGLDLNPVPDLPLF
jgi:N6-L-threonylcarbamoyladenine synthase